MIYTGKTMDFTDAMDGVIPRGYIYADPPDDKGIWQWASTRWVELKEYPKPPEPVPSTSIDKVALVEKLIAAGHADQLDALLASSPAAIRHAWYAYSTIDLADKRVTEFFASAKIDIGEVLKAEK